MPTLELFEEGVSQENIESKEQILRDREWQLVRTGRQGVLMNILRNLPMKGCKEIGIILEKRIKYKQNVENCRKLIYNGKNHN